MSIIETYDNFCIDLDGVMWNGNNAIPGSIEAINYLKSNEKKIFFVTNNASLTRDELETKFKNLGFDTDVGNLYTTGYAISKYLKIYFREIRKLTVLGMPGLRKYLQDEGYNVVYPPELDTTLRTLEDFNNFDVVSDIDVVIAAYDVNFDYFSALYCCACLQNGAEFIGLNQDRFFIFGKFYS